MVKEGYMPFKGYKTYYKIVGSNYSNPPLILLHGGPGSTHNYFELLDIVSDLTRRPIIEYDQIGCGNSYTENKELFNMKTWKEELDSLIKYLKLDTYYLLGQSFGGMLLLDFLINDKPKGLKGIILSSTLSDATLWHEEGLRMIELMSVTDATAIKEAFLTNDYNNPLYISAINKYMEMHCAPDFKNSSYECLKREKKVGSIAYKEAWGENEIYPTGNLKDYNLTERLKEINVKTLILSGGNDLSTPYINKVMNDNIKGSIWHLFRTSRHMPFYEERDEYIKILSEFLNECDKI